MAAGVFGYWFLFMRGFVATDDARFAGHLVDLAPEINGTIVAVPVHAGQFVRQGSIVFQLDPAIFESALKQAEAALSSARASLASSEAKCARAVNGSRPEEIKAAEAVARRLQNEEELARLNFERVQSLFKQGTVSQDDFDRARTALESARQSREYALQNLSLLRQGSRKEDVDIAKADVELARSRINEASSAADNARSNLARCRSWPSPLSACSIRRRSGWMPISKRSISTRSPWAMRWRSRWTPIRRSTSRERCRKSCGPPTRSSA
jgi:multidrug resistance efflux pump